MAKRKKRLAPKTKTFLGTLKHEFIAWLKDHEYAPCDKTYPMAVLATELVDTYLQDYAEQEKYNKLIKVFASTIGYVSDYRSNEPVTEEPAEDEENYFF